MSTTPAILSDTEVVVLEALDFDVQCESKHLDPESGPCTVTATHLATVHCLRLTIMVCANSASFRSRSFTSGGWCARCFRPTTDCWTVTPLGEVSA